MRVANEAEFILNRQRAEDVHKHAEFEVNRDSPSTSLYCSKALKYLPSGGHSFHPLLPALFLLDKTVRTFISYYNLTCFDQKCYTFSYLRLFILVL